MSSVNEDKELTSRTLKGEKKAFEMIIQKYQQPLLNYAYRTMGEREIALELTQEVFIKAYYSLVSYRPQYKFSTWLFKIASNTIIDYWRKKKIDTFSIDCDGSKENYSISFQIPDDEVSVVEKFELSELRKRIETALGKIPSALRELFVCRHINGFSYDEIAEIKSLPVGTVKNRVFQAKELIRRHLEEER